MSAISGYPQQSSLTLEQLQTEASTPTEVRTAVLNAFADAGISVDEMSNPAEIQTAIESALATLDLDAATPAEVLAAVEAALAAKNVPAKSDLDAVHADVLATKAAVEAIEIPEPPEGLTAAVIQSAVADALQAGGTSTLTTQQVSDAVNALLTDRGLSLTQIQYALETAVGGGHAETNEVRMFSGSIPAGWEQVQGPVYDLAIGKWIVLPPMFDALIALGAENVSGPSMAAEGGKVYVCCGDAINAGSALAVFDPALGTWTPLTALPYAAVRPCLVGLGDGRLLLFGGNAYDEEWAPVALRDCYVYDIATGTWSAAAQVPGNKADGARAVLLPSGKVLVFGRSNQYNIELDLSIWEYDPDLNSWSVKTTTHPEFVKGCCVLPSGKVLIVFIDYESNPSYAVYDPSADTFTTPLASVPGATSWYDFLLVSHEEGALLYQVDRALAFNEATGQWLPFSGHAPSGWPWTWALVPNVGVFVMQAMPVDAFTFLPAGSLPRAIRYARKL